MWHLSCREARTRSRVTPLCVGLAVVVSLIVSPVSAQDSVRETISEEGLRVWSFPDDGGDRFLMMVLVGAGSRHEDDSKLGIAHLLEHVLLGSTKEWSKSESRVLLDNIGGSMNGYTKHGVTTFYLRCSSESWQFGVDWLAAHLVNPAFNQSDVNDERRIVFEELDLKQSHAGVNPLGSLFYPGHPLERDIGGDKWGIEDLTRDDLREFHAENYRSVNMAIGFAGNVPREECTDKILKEFAGLGSTGELAEIDPVVPEAGTTRLPRSLGEDGWMLTGYHLPASNAAAKAAQLVVSRYLAKRSFEVVREENQLSYEPSVSLKHFTDTTRLEFQLNVSESSNLSKVVKLFGALVLELAAPKASVLESAKREADVSLQVNDFSDLGLAMELSWFVRRRGQSPLDLERSLRQISSQDVADYAGAHLVREHRFTLTDGFMGGTPWILRALGISILLVLVDAMRGFAWTNAIRVRWVERHKRAVARDAKKREGQRKKGKVLPMRGSELEASFQKYFEDEDGEES